MQKFRGGYLNSRGGGAGFWNQCLMFHEFLNPLYSKYCLYCNAKTIDFGERCKLLVSHFRKTNRGGSRKYEQRNVDRHRKRWKRRKVGSWPLCVISLPPASKWWGRSCIHRCLSVHRGMGYPSTSIFPRSVIPCPFLGYPSPRFFPWPLVPGPLPRGVYPSPSWGGGYPNPGQWGYPSPGRGYTSLAEGVTQSWLGVPQDRGIPSQDRTGVLPWTRTGVLNRFL